MCPVSGQTRVMAAIVLTSQASDGLEQFPKDPCLAADYIPPGELIDSSNILWK